MIFFMKLLQISQAHCPLARWCDNVISASHPHDQPCANLTQL